MFGRKQSQFVVESRPWSPKSSLALWISCALVIHFSWFESEMSFPASYAIWLTSWCSFLPSPSICVIKDYWLLSQTDGQTDEQRNCDKKWNKHTNKAKRGERWPDANRQADRQRAKVYVGGIISRWKNERQISFYILHLNHAKFQGEKKNRVIKKIIFVSHIVYLHLIPFQKQCFVIIKKNDYC